MKTGPQLLKSSLWVHFAAAAVHKRWHFNLLVRCPHSCCLSGWVMELKDREKRGRLPAGKLSPSLPSFVAVLNQKGERFFSLLVSQLCDVENSAGGKPARELWRFWKTWSLDLCLLREHCGEGAVAVCNSPPQRCFMMLSCLKWVPVFVKSMGSDFHL